MAGLYPPRVSVVMPVYRGDEYLPEAVNSILHQTFTDFEFIIICDDPTEKTHQILDEYKQSDSRIRVYYQKREGLVNSLNRGCSLARGEYIARMDADDISLPERFEKQIAFMEANPEIGISGTWLRTIGDGNRVWSPPIYHDDIFAEMLFDSMIYHPTVIIRKDIIFGLHEFYDDSFKHAEDMEYWSRLMSLGVKMANIGEVLLLYRIHKNRVGNIYNSVQKQNAEKIRHIQLKRLGIGLSEEKCLLHRALHSGGTLSDRELIEHVSLWIDTIRMANTRSGVFSDAALSKVLGHRWFRLCYNSAGRGLWIWNIYSKQQVSGSMNLTYIQKFLLLTKCLLHIDNIKLKLFNNTITI